MSVTAVGLLLDIIGVVLLGLSAISPKIDRAGYLDLAQVVTGRPAVIAKWGGWVLLLLGFTLQLLAETGVLLRRGTIDWTPSTTSANFRHDYYDHP